MRVNVYFLMYFSEVGMYLFPSKNVTFKMHKNKQKFQKI